METIDDTDKLPDLNGDDLNRNKNKISYFIGMVTQSIKDFASQTVTFQDQIETLSMKVDDKIDNLSLTYNTLNQKVALFEKESELNKETLVRRFDEIEKKATEFDNRSQRDYKRINDFDEELSKAQQSISNDLGKVKQDIKDDLSKVKQDIKDELSKVKQDIKDDLGVRLGKVENTLKIDDGATSKSRNTINYILIIALALVSFMTFYSDCRDKRTLDSFKSDLSTIQKQIKE
jgi:hypothetical protein